MFSCAKSNLYFVNFSFGPATAGLERALQKSLQIFGLPPHCMRFLITFIVLMAESLALCFGDDLSGNSALTINYNARTQSSSSSSITITPLSGWSVMYITETSHIGWPAFDSSAFYTGGSLTVSCKYISTGGNYTYINTDSYLVSGGTVGLTTSISISGGKNSKWFYFIM